MAMTADAAQTIWLGLVIGNTRLHWAAFSDQQWLGTWHTDHLSAEQVRHLMATQFAPESWQGIAGSHPPEIARPPKTVWLAAVVPKQRDLWRGHAQVQEVALDCLPLTSLYSTLGIDRALALLGAGSTYGWPILVIDGGTALTLTAGDRPPGAETGCFAGGAILPGLSLQVRALPAQTEALPEIFLPDSLPPRWANTTVEAIQSGIIHTVIGGLQDYLQDWCQQHPQGQVIFTGGDGDRLLAYLTESASFNANTTHKNDPVASCFRVDENLVFWGLRAYRNQLKGC
ncbi:pantothenate kinase [filamentous cyanobacterium CCP5]|nr:pantothenate kinase [filamentous cyanobacterium CCP5]